MRYSVHCFLLALSVMFGCQGKEERPAVKEDPASDDATGEATPTVSADLPVGESNAASIDATVSGTATEYKFYFSSSHSLGYDCANATYGDFQSISTKLTISEAELGADGIKTVCIVGKNSTGTESEPELYQWKKNTAPPTEKPPKVTVQDIQDEYSEDSIELTIKAEHGATHYQYGLKQGNYNCDDFDAEDYGSDIEVGADSGKFTLSNLANEDYTLCVRGKNGAKLQEDVSQYIFEKVDPDSPESSAGMLDITTSQQPTRIYLASAGKGTPKIILSNEGDSEQRSEIVANLAEEPVRVLVATDCLSEGVNLQDHYDAVVHYDLPWNPNRLEQREGRVDRFGQSRDVIKTVLLYGSDNEMDLAVLKVLLEKAQTIRRRLGISVPVPVESEQVINTLIKSVLLRGDDRAQQFRLALEHESVSRLHDAWERMAEREIKARNYFAQRGIEPDDVARELEETEPVLGSAEDLKRFVANAVQRFNGELRATREAGVYLLNPGDLQERIAARDPAIRFPMRVSFEDVPIRGAIPLRRNHPAAAALAEAVLAKALEGADTRFARAGAIFTRSVNIRTVVLVLRLRYLIEDRSARQFAEEVTVGAFRRDADHPGRLVRVEEDGLRLLAEAEPTVNMAPAEREEHVGWALDMLEPNGSGWADGIVGERKAALEGAHRRLRRAVDGGGASVEPHPPDIIGCYVLVPAGG